MKGIWGIWVVCSVAIGANAGTITVTSPADNGPGTLRTAIAAAATNDVIKFSLSLPATITLITGELFISKNLTITGPGQNSLTINGNNGSRVLDIGTSNTVAISNLTISGGSASGGGVGAGIYADHATLTLTNCAVRNNNATGGSTAAGAGIYSSQSQLVVTGCTIDGSTAGGNGGGIYNDIGSSLVATNCTISGNTGLSGGGIYNASGTVTARNCLFYQNAATHGGGIGNVGAGATATLNINNCTFSSNSVAGASATGSQIYNHRQTSVASASIASSTILSDSVSPTYSGGALFNDNGGTITIGNTIIKTGASEGTINAPTGNITSAGYNLVTDAAGNFLTGTGDQINTDPLLDTGTGLRDNGGPTRTIALRANSPAIDKGKSNAIASLASRADQRGEQRPFDELDIPSAAGGDGSDIGAYEADLRTISLVRVSSNLQLSFTSVVGKTYQLQSRASLKTGNWNSFGAMAAGSGGLAQLTASNAFNSPIQFYRVIQIP